MYLVFEYTFKHCVRMAHLSLHFIQSEIISLHMDVKERTRVHLCEICILLTKLRDGGPGWTRTSDPTLIKRVL
jgi:hypothetical protein